MWALIICSVLVLGASAGPAARTRGKPVMEKGFVDANFYRHQYVGASPEFEPEVPGSEASFVHRQFPHLSEVEPLVAVPQGAQQKVQNPVEARHSHKPHLQSLQQPSQSLESHPLRSLLKNVPANSQLLSINSPKHGLLSRLPDNATLLLNGPLVDTFSCQGRVYGYYSDVDNKCKIFHVCLPLHQLFPTRFTADTTIQYSFVCGNTTSFDQASMACVHDSNFICDQPELYYHLNKNFFKKIPSPSGGTQWAWINSEVPPDYVFKPDVGAAGGQ